jgi:hypothetical protein
MLKRIRYVSRQVRPMSESEIDAMVEAAATANEGNDITGALVVADEVFFQIIEGPSANIDALYAKLEADRRHTDVVCLDAAENREIRLFPKWAMRRVDKRWGAATERMKYLVRRLPAATERQRAELTDELASLMRSSLRAA